MLLIYAYWVASPASQCGLRQSIIVQNSIDEPVSYNRHTEKFSEDFDFIWQQFAIIEK
jgi:hypothetical protein